MANQFKVALLSEVDDQALKASHEHIKDCLDQLISGCEDSMPEMDMPEHKVIACAGQGILEKMKMGDAETATAALMLAEAVVRIVKMKRDRSNGTQSFAA